MVPQRSLAPSWSPDSRWVAFASRLDTLYRAIVVADLQTGERRQITDGLADATYPVWDASGKYLWFLASTDMGLRSQWLDMTSYERLQTFGLYVAVLRKGEPSPVLPQSDEDAGVGVKVEATPLAAASGPVVIDFDGLPQRVIAVPGAGERQQARGVADAECPARYSCSGRRTVFGRARRVPGAAAAARCAATGSAERTVANFAANVADYAVSADGKKLVYRTPSRPAADGGAGTPSVLHLVDAADKVPDAGAGRLTATLRMQLDPKAEFDRSSTRAGASSATTSTSRTSRAPTGRR